MTVYLIPCLDLINFWSTVYRQSKFYRIWTCFNHRGPIMKQFICSNLQSRLYNFWIFPSGSLLCKCYKNQCIKAFQMYVIAIFGFFIVHCLTKFFSVTLNISFDYIVACLAICLVCYLFFRYSESICFSLDLWKSHTTISDFNVECFF